MRGRVPVRIHHAELEELNHWTEVLERTKTQAEELLAQAQEQANALLAQAEAESQALRDQAREEGRREGHSEGYETGYAEGLSAGRDELLEQLNVVYQLMEEAASFKAALIAGAEAEIVELVIDVARKVIGEVVELNPEVTVGLVADAIEHANAGDVLTIRLNPRDVEVLREYWAEALEHDDPPTGPSAGSGGSPGPPNRRWEILADRRVKPGGCVIDTEAGTVDARIDTQLVQIKYAFDKATANENGNEETRD